MIAAEAPEALSGLGTNANTVTPFVASETLRRQDHRRLQFARRAQSSAWLLDDARELVGDGDLDVVKVAARPATCGWSAGPSVTVRRSVAGVASFSGVQRCASVHACACCGPMIRSHRGDEVQQTAEWWEGQGGQFLFLTFTVRHKAADPLAHSLDVVTGAFTAMIKGSPWKRFSRVHGVRHWIKSLEVTLGHENGWHAHLHVLLAVDPYGAAEDLADDADAALADAFAPENLTVKRLPKVAKLRKADRLLQQAREAAVAAEQGIGVERKKAIHGWLHEHWADAVERLGGRRPSERRGVDVRTVRDGKVVALYIAKTQEGDRAPRPWKIGHELARSDFKTGRAESLVPLELLDVDGLDDDQVAWQREHWIEYVSATAGKRSMTWSRGLKAAAGLADLDDDQVIDADTAEVESQQVVIVIESRHWTIIRNDPDACSRILDLVESDRLDEVLSVVPYRLPHLHER